MSVSQPPEVKLTYEEYVLYPNDGNRHEIIDGLHYMNAAPSPRHQTVSRLIQFQLMEQIEIPGHGEVFNAPIDLHLDTHDVVQPDIVVVMAGNCIVTTSKVKGVPDLVVEILSPSTRDYDLKLKRRLYERVGVPEYWIVDPEECTVIVCKLASGKYEDSEPANRQLQFSSGSHSATVDLQKVW